VRNNCNAEERKVGPLEQDYVKLQPGLPLRLFSKSVCELQLNNGSHSINALPFKSLRFYFKKIIF